MTQVGGNIHNYKGQHTSPGKKATNLSLFFHNKHSRPTVDCLSFLSWRSLCSAICGTSGVRDFCLWNLNCFNGTKELDNYQFKQRLKKCSFYDCIICWLGVSCTDPNHKLNFHCFFWSDCVTPCLLNQQVKKETNQRSSQPNQPTSLPSPSRYLKLCWNLHSGQLLIVSTSTSSALNVVQCLVNQPPPGQATIIILLI